MTGAIGLPEDPQEEPLETEEVGEDAGGLPAVQPDNTSEPVDVPAVEPGDPVEPTLIEPEDAGEPAVPLQPPDAQDRS